MKGQDEHARSTAAAAPLQATALWIERPGQAALHRAPLPPGGDDAVLVRMAFSGISRGTERIVFEGRVPESQRQRMRCPYQEGAFPGPVKYGYSAVGRIEAGPLDRLGQTVFCLHPHQDLAWLPASAARRIPDGVPAGRAILAANMETAVNALWDAGATIGDRIVVFGAGLVGCLVGYLAARLPGTMVIVADTNPDRQMTVEALGCRFAGPGMLDGLDPDILINASGAPAALQRALDIAGFESRIVELSWYGDREIDLRLGETFHSGRLSLVSSQVGTVAAPRRQRRRHEDRLDLALALLGDPRLDRLISGETRFADLPAALPEILADPGTLCHRIAYG